MDKVTVFEFDEISAGDGEKQLKKSDFELLKSFILPQNNGDVEQEVADIVTDASVCMTLGVRGGKEVIIIKNYVGIVSLKSGTQIEILPKIADKSTKEEIRFARTFVVEMLKSCGKIPYKSFQRARLSYENMNLYEIYIRLFLDELNDLYKRGLKAGYVPYEGNENFLKGKLIFGEHIRRNFAHKEKFYVGYDVFSFDRVENRLIKSTLLYLHGKSKDESNKRDIKRMLLIFEDITPSNNCDGDFAKCGTDRTVKEYADIILLCKVFLHKKSFTMYGGQNDATALLFPMDRLFESYVAEQMSKIAYGHGWILNKQDRGKYLFGEEYSGKFPLRPDIVLSSKQLGDEIIIVDTKWKRIYNDPKSNYGISQADMYQMYAYHTRYENVKKVVLLYPYYEYLNAEDYTTNVGKKQVTIQIRTFDLRGYIEDHKPFENCIMPNDCIFAN